MEKYFKLELFAKNILHILNYKLKTNTVMNYTQKISKIASKRRNGDVPRISEVLDNTYSTSHITNVLNGARFNDRIVNAAYRLLYRRESNATKLSKLTTQIAAAK